jgi:hypothetical protein
MAIPKKKSRIITIDDIQYRWIVGPNDGYNVFVAEKENVKGCKIEVFFETDINSYWVEFPNVESLNLKILKPKDAETIIQQAIKMGWNPDEKGAPFIFDWIEEKLIKRSQQVTSIKSHG